MFVILLRPFCADQVWKIQREAYFSLSGLDDQAGEKQVQALTLSFSRETLTIVENLGLTQRKSAKEIITAIETYVNGQINESVERRAFRSRVQHEGEMFNDFVGPGSQKKRCRIQPSIPTLTTDVLPTHNLEGPHRSTRVQNKPNRLIEEIGISSFHVEDDQEVPVGEM